MKAAAAVRRLAFQDRLPWLAGLHTQEEDEEFFRSVLFARSVVWGAFADGSLVGMMALKPGWIGKVFWGAHSTLELPVGAIRASGTAKGDKIAWEDHGG